MVRPQQPILRRPESWVTCGILLRPICRVFTRRLHEVHVNTLEGFWSLLRSWLRPHRGISQEKLPLYLGFFQFVHNTRRRGKALLGALIAALVA